MERINCEVTCVYEISKDELERFDEEFAEGDLIRFSRGVNVNGSGYFKFNGKRLRWSNYNEYLEKINILVKTRNFLVFQGEVETIASKSPKQLTELFEHISGSEELKERYDQLVEAVEEANEKTRYANEKRQTVNKDVKTTKEEKKEAELFVKTQQELQDFKIMSYLCQLCMVHDDRKVSVKEMASQEIQIREHEAKSEEAAKTVKSAKTSYAKLKNKEKKLLTQQHKLEKEQHAKQPSVVSAKASLEHLNKRRVALDKNIETLEKRIADQKKSEKRLGKKKKELNDELENVNTAIEKGDAALRENLEKGAAQMEQYEELKAKARQESGSLPDELKDIEGTFQIHDNAVSGLESTLDELVATRESHEKEVDALGKRIAKLEEGIASKERDIEKRQNQSSELEEQYKVAKGKREELEDQREIVAEQLREYKTNQSQNKHQKKLDSAVIDLKRLFDGVHGRLCDLVKIPNSKYKMALLSAVGKYHDALIVEDDQTTKNCIEHLRVHHVGRLLFLPMEKLQVPSIPEDLRALGKGYHPAIDVVEYPDVIDRAVRFACSTAVICDNMDLARKLRFELNREVKAVTLKGATISKGGIMAGGHTAKEVEQRLARWDEKKVSDLHTRVRTLNEKLQNLDTGHATQQRIRELERRISADETSVSLKRKDLSISTEKLQNEQEAVKRIMGQEKGIQKKLDAALKEKETGQAEINRITTEIREIEDVVFADFCQELGVENIHEYEEGRLLRVQKLREDRDALEKKLIGVEDELKQMDPTKLENRLKEANRKYDHFGQQIKLAESKSERLQKQQDALTGKIDSIKEKMFEIRNDVNEATEELRAAQRDQKDQDKELADANVAKSKIQARLESLSGRRKDIIERAILEDVEIPTRTTATVADEPSSDEEDEEAEPSFKRARQAKEDVYDFERLDPRPPRDETGRAQMMKEYKKDIQKLQEQLDKMKPNMRAMEKYSKCHAKFMEHTKQCEAARRESNRISEEFEKVKKERSEKFNTAFKAVRERLVSIYKRLTRSEDASDLTAGTAYLEVESHDEPYNAGVKYSCMPPMKRFREMEQLSGGERVIAALALRFAIHSYRPSPFFVLDEIDAPLDNVNVAKLCNFIRESKDKMQVIIISLKHIFYEKADSLVGITKTGDCSRTLTMDLTQFD
eukprot:TRINITY_DN228_c5_g1_i1.p1 TRINITY_DN228_c5_g1~~TRINITY_DN228_c5_g1_i1.p1  ORF type:complete len:1247 (-),score=467.12 TRINITY_DN228_c5_g1_i1:180-3653(-)